MIRFYLIIGFFIYASSGYSQIGIEKISYLVGKKQKDATGKFKRHTFFQVRKKLFEKYPSIFKDKIDTIYFVEKYDVEEGCFYGLIWTSSDTVSYSFHAKEIKLSDVKIFSKKTLRLISSWDTTQIRKEEMLYSNSSQTVYASRCVVINNLCFIDVIKMKELLFE